MKYVYDLHKLMQEKKILLTYDGEFSQEITKAVLAMTERNLDSLKEDSSTKRKVFKVMVECLQNIVKHSDESDMESNFNSAIFAITQTDDFYEIVTGNYMFSSNRDIVEAKIEQVNSLDSAGLKDLYKNIMRNGELSDKGGAGLGFIDMARKSGEKLNYDFHEINEEYSFFILITRISRNK